MIQIKQAAQDVGFDLVGIASAQDPELKNAVIRYHSWLESGFAASMEYLKKHEELKAQPQKLLAEWKSVICVALLYGEKAAPVDKSAVQVSLYTRGEDYHLLMTRKLAELAKAVSALDPNIRVRPFVDSEPVLERFWAWRAGLGWIGKNACLIHRKSGSLMFLGGLLTTQELVPDAVQPDHCGKCRKCIEACPTQAILETRGVNSTKCIAYHTIENRGAIPNEIMQKSDRWIAGCDICQTVCPWNDPVTESHAFVSSNPTYNAPIMQLIDWSAQDFKEKLQGIAMNRMKYSGYLRNLTIAAANSELSADQKRIAYEKLSSHVSELSPGAGKDGAIKALEWACKKL